MSITSISYYSSAFTKRIRTLAVHNKLLVSVNTPQRSRHSPHYCRVGNNPELKGSLKFKYDLKAYWNCIKTLKHGVLVINFIRKNIFFLKLCFFTYLWSILYSTTNTTENQVFVGLNRHVNDTVVVCGTLST